ncbi:hypothetical protein [Paraburkholderia sediminicola]|uniref:hypothetical protein n=1 Tax=Paraburkholderia sediminicola TaxID=458836 RepID=UPI0038B9418A
MIGELGLPQLLNRLELALAGTPDRTTIWKALSDLNERLASIGKKSSCANQSIHAFATSAPTGI